MRILLVDDDPRLRELVRIALERAGWQVITAADGQEALLHASRDAPDLIVLDIGLPELDGFEVCRRIRQRSQVPILFLTARDDEVDCILGLELGADDYVTKPFSPRELVARIRAILKRTQSPNPSTLLAHGLLSLDPSGHRCMVSGREVALTAKEQSILTLLLQDPARIRSRAELITQIWGAGSQVSDRTLDSHLRNLRAKLHDAGGSDPIETLHAVGIRLRALPA
ncbi:response regulator transcription factor [Pseudophaeobacter sp.]|uniref:response regulator transcription factor n=1 Tax=Pseudophaeobacter sp. TaxID=1971739 RepID=UPI00405845D9